MNALDIVTILLNQNRVTEATVRRPPRSSRWVAVITGIEPGTQIARSTGLSNRHAALAKAQQWEQAARKERARKRAEAPSDLENGQGHGGAGLTQAEIAALLGLSERTVRNIEKRALRKLRHHPLLRELWAEYAAQSPMDEASLYLAPEEVEALFELAHTDIELHALRKVLAQSHAAR